MHERERANSQRTNASHSNRRQTRLASPRTDCARGQSILCSVCCLSGTITHTDRHCHSNRSLSLDRPESLFVCVCAFISAHLPSRAIHPLPVVVYFHFHNHCVSLTSAARHRLSTRLNISSSSTPRGSSAHRAVCVLAVHYLSTCLFNRIQFNTPTFDLRASPLPDTVGCPHLFRPSLSEFSGDSRPRGTSCPSTYATNC